MVPLEPLHNTHPLGIVAIEPLQSRIVPDGTASILPWVDSF